MSENRRQRYSAGPDDTQSRPSDQRQRYSSGNQNTRSSTRRFDTSSVSRALEAQADGHVRRARRETTYSTGPLPSGQEISTRRSRRNDTDRLPRIPDPDAEYRDSAAARKERRRLRQEAERWMLAHRIVRLLIVIALVLDVIILRFGVFRGGFLPVWNVLTAGRHSQQTQGASQEIGLNISEQLLTVNEYSRPGTALDGVNGIVIHYIGNPGTDAQDNRDYFENLKEGTSGTYASCNYIIGLDGTIIQCVPDNEVAYASGPRNNDTISIECCHPDESGAFTAETYTSLVLLTAKLCREYDLSTEQLLRHYDVNEKPCPRYFVEDPDAWNNFLASVQENL